MTDAPWWAARSLAERRGDASAGDVDEDRAARWAAALGSAEALGQRLAAAGVRPDELARVLGPGPPPPGTDAPEWWRAVEEALEPDDRRPIADRDDVADADVARGALRLVAPFARRAFRRWRAHPEGGNAAARSLTDALATELVELCRPAVAFELVATAAVEGWSPDDPAAAARLLRGLGDADRARTVLGEHPGLARMVATRTRAAVEAGLELLDRVAADRVRVRDELLGGAEPGELVAVDASGDAHDGGRRVAVLRFASGARAVLKPRPMEADAAYQRLLGALNVRGFAPRFGPLATIACDGGYGWQAFAVTGDCADEAEVDAYFRRLGGQLAVLHALHATDIHQENVLACGAHPVVVDLETVLHPRLGAERADAVDPLIAETGLHSVLRVGLLPRRDVAFGVDISGLGRDPDGVVQVDERAWGGARASVRRVTLQPGANAARLRGTAVRPHHHVDALAAGFAAAYDLLVAHREALLSPGGELAAFAGIPIRLVLRPTKVYVDLLRGQSEGLECLDDGLAREERLNVLWRGAARRPELGRTAPAEHDDLWAGDVPRVAGTVGTADGHHHARGALPGLLGPHTAPGPDAVRRLDADDRARQLALLRASVLAAAADDGLVAPVEPGTTPGPLDAAVRAGRRLAVLALHEHDRAGWLRTSGTDGRGTLEPLDATLDRGQAGVVLALARLAAVTGDPGTGALAAAARRQLVRLRAARATGDRDEAGALLALGSLDVPDDEAGAWAARPVVVAGTPSARLLARHALVTAVRATRGTASGSSRALDAVLGRLDDTAREAPLTGALALARAAARPGADPRAAGAAGRLALAAPASAPAAARVLALAGAVGVAGRAAREDLLSALEGATRTLPPGDDDEPTAVRIERDAARTAALCALGGRPDAPSDVAPPPGPPAFARGVEVPVLDGGLAGAVLGWLALVDGRAAADLAAVLALRAEPLPDA